MKTQRVNRPLCWSAALAILTLLISSSLKADLQLPANTPVPGGIARIAIAAELIDNPDTVSAYYQGSRVMLLPPTSDHNADWTAVVGLPLDATAGKHQLTLKNPPGKTHKVAFEVKPKTYQEQRITLTNTRQVNPLEQDLVRINRESQIIVAAFKSWNTQLSPSLPLAQPVSGPISSPFGLQRFFNDQPRKPHSGLDIAAPEGTPIQAPAAAAVLATGNYFFNGNTILLDHGHGLVSMYCHLSEIRVKAGDIVQGKDIIGLVGKTGRATGPHLHWSVSLNNARIDPDLLMQ